MLLCISITESKKKILVNIFPGAKSHNFVMKELFDYTRSKNESYEYHIIIHNSDRSLWNQNYTLHSYGDLDKYEVYFKQAIEQVQRDPIFGYNKFSKAMIHVYEQFLESNVLNDLRKYKYDMLITDIPNYISKFLKKELNIPNFMFLSPPCLPNLFYEDFELNSSYTPSIGTPFTERMNFFERFMNSVYIFGIQFLFEIFKYQHIEVFRRYGYEIDGKLFTKDYFIMIQCPLGISFNLPLPPNFVKLNAITPREANKLTDSKLDNFINNHKKNVYLSQGTIMNVIDINEIIDVFNKLPEYGFILSFKGDTYKGLNFPKNVLLVTWVNQNDLLGDERLTAFISHCGINSVMEALYHEKAVIGLGLALDQLNTCAYIKEKKFGIAIMNRKEVTSNNLVKAIENVETDFIRQNIKKYSRILKSNDNPRKVFHYWLQYGFDYGYEHLIVSAYKHLNDYQLFNYDIILIWVFIFAILFYIVKKIFVCIFCSCKAKKKIKSE
jgi:hypothetical protein